MALRKPREADAYHALQSRHQTMVNEAVLLTQSSQDGYEAGSASALTMFTKVSSAFAELSGGAAMLLHHLFATMNEVLDDIIQQYPSADPERKAELNEQMSALRKMSEDILEEWLRFEEKMGKSAAVCTPVPKPQAAGSAPKAEDPERRADAFVRGQGYYKLWMFPEAVKQFEQVVEQYPDFLLGRIFLAMGYFRAGNDAEAYRHFQLLLPLTDNEKMKAISYNAMGCIHARKDNMEQAYAFFKKAYQTDPSCMDSLVNMDVCLQKHGDLQITADFIRE